MNEEDRSEIRKMIEEKDKNKQQAPFWQNLPPIVLIIGGAMVFFAFKSMTMTKDNNQYFIFILILAAVLYMMGQKKDIETIMLPDEAEANVWKEIERKQRWGQVDYMCQFKVGPVNPLQHTDGRGIFYAIGVEKINPYHKSEYWVARVMASGKERGIVTFEKSIGAMNGREIKDVHDITKVPAWIKMSDKYPSIRDWMFKGGRYER